jgi:capsular exopolysaccharide synthesis family protein
MSLLIVHKDPKSPSAEAYRTLRTNILFSSMDNDIKTLLVTSPGPGEGKSITAANLAITMSQVGKKVLLIDCDMRRPSLHEVFGISKEVGLTDLLMEELEIGEVVHKYSENLNILTCGTIPQNPSEVLASRVMKRVLEEAAKEYNFIILDTPPVIAVTDAQILATRVEGVILVINSSVTPIEASKKAKNLLKAVNANIIGVVLNKVKTKKGSYYTYYGKENNKKRVRT